MDNFRHKKSLGQNFLHDDIVLNKIVESTNVKSDDLVIEIGPGMGSLTKKLKDLNCNLVCYEIDERVKETLQKLEDEKTRIIFTDFLKADILNDIKKVKYDNLFVIANLPYYITTPIIEKIIEVDLPVKEMILMVQNEVADRFNANPGTKSYGSLTVYLNYYFDIEKLFIVKRTSFKPIPNVDSAVIKFKKRDKYQVKNEDYFFKLIRNAFKQKRKNIRNNLFNYDLNVVEQILLDNNLSLQSRAEEIDIAVFVELSNQLSSQI